MKEQNPSISSALPAELDAFWIENCLNHLNDAILITEAEPKAEPGPRILWANDVFYQATGFEPSDVIGKTPRILQGPLTDKSVLETLSKALKNWEVCRVEVLNYKKDGTTYWSEFEVTPIANEAGWYTHWISVQRDITERKQAEIATNAMVADIKQFKYTLDQTLDCLFMFRGDDYRFIYANQGAINQVGYTRDELLGMTALDIKPEFTQESFTELTQPLRDGTKASLVFETVHRHKDGHDTPVEVLLQYVRIEDSEPRYIGVVRDITERQKSEENLKKMALYDLLTDLPNRVLLSDRLSKSMLQCQRNNQSLGVAFMDLDGFKSVNDAYGHSAGDDLLVTLSQRMKQSLRKGDTLARIGGDEFIVLMTDLGKIENSEPLIERLLKAVSDPVIIGDELIEISASIGLTLYPDDQVDAEQLIRHADQAMYSAKQSGKNRCYIFDIEKDNEIFTRRVNRNEIRRASDRNEFVLYYQPKVNMRTGRAVGAEALIRWQHPERGLVAPLDFLPLIEGHKLSIEIGEWVVNTALGQISQWQKLGINLPISVNISPYQLTQENFPDRMASILAQHPDVDPHCLELEILETSSVENFSKVADIMTACYDLGLSFALDDFGTGFSPLTYLRRLPASTIKIDQSFVRDMLEDDDDLAIIEGIIGLAKSFQRTVIAEGVETIAHGQALVELGCDLGQGYGFAQPMPSGDIPTWICTWTANNLKSI